MGFTHVEEPPEPDSDDSSDDDEQENTMPQIALKQFERGARLSKWGKKANVPGMAVDLELIKINERSVVNYPVKVVNYILLAESRPMRVVFQTSPASED